MPSFWEHTRLDVLHVPGVATRVSTRSIAITCAPTSLAAPPPDIPAHARWIPPRALESPGARENPPRAEIIRAGGERGSVPLPVGLTNREPCPRVVRIAGNAFSSAKPRFDRGKIRLQCKVMTSNVICTSVNEGVQPRERRSHPAERRSTSSDDSSNPQFPGPSNS